MITTDSGSDDGRESTDAPAVDFAQYRARRRRARLLELLDTLVVAMERRDLQAVRDVLSKEEAVSWFPGGLCEEALVIASLPAGSLRAPLRTYRYYHQLQQLGDEPLELADDPRQLTLDLTSPAGSPSMILFPARSTAPPDDPRRGGGADRRRSGSR